MAHGTPDWGVTSGAATVYQLTDLGELAVRLGSIVTHDRRGDVVWLEAFENGLIRWFTASSGTGAAVYSSAQYARNGPFSAALIAGSNASALATISHYQPFSVLSRHGLEVSLSYPLSTDMIDFFMDLYNGTNLITFAIRLRLQDDDLQYRNSAGVYVTFATSPNAVVLAALFHTAKLVVDLDNKQYVRFILNDREYDLSGIDGQQAASSVGAHLAITITNRGRLGNNDAVYLDDVILTQNEPA